MVTFVVICVLIGSAAVQSITGSGFGMLAAPALALVRPDLVPGPLLVLTVVMMCLMTGQRRHWDKPTIAIVTTTMIPGVLVGAWILSVCPLAVVEVTVAGAAIASGLILLTGRTLTTTRTTLAGAGLAAGIMGTLAAMPGPPLALSYRRTDPTQLRATLSVFFLLMSVVGVTGLTARGQFTPADLGLAVLLAPVVLVGNLIGRFVAPRVEIALINRTTTVAILVSASVLLAKGVHDLSG